LFSSLTVKEFDILKICLRRKVQLSHYLLFDSTHFDIAENTGIADPSAMLEADRIVDDSHPLATPLRGTRLNPLVPSLT
jgi:hypothetical protein